MTPDLDGKGQDEGLGHGHIIKSKQFILMDMVLTR